MRVCGPAAPPAQLTKSAPFGGDSETGRPEEPWQGELCKPATDAATTIPHAVRVFTREQLMNGGVLSDEVARRGAGVEVLLEPYWIFTQTGATHDAAFGYDAHVPAIFRGPGIRAGCWA
jgi:hypothetical protein